MKVRRIPAPKIATNVTHITAGAPIYVKTLMDPTSAAAEKDIRKMEGTAQVCIS